MNPKKIQKIKIYTSAYIIIFISLIFFILPILWIIYCSFRTQPSIFTGKIFSSLKDFSLENYLTIMSVADFPVYFFNSFKIASFVTLLSVTCSIFGAYGLSRFKIKGKNKNL